jgi:S1-C subfamily serine protease
LGSGVIVTEDGYVLTNHHVIAGASQIRIALWDGRVTQANLIGSDADTDLAVLKMEGSALPALPLDARGTQAKSATWCWPSATRLGLSQTVTQGIVISGSSRNQLNLRAYEDFIQTDAAINEGNSGGALINARGQLIGINTFVLGRINGAEGIGFAIPMSTASAVFEEIKQHGARGSGLDGRRIWRCTVAAWQLGYRCSTRRCIDSDLQRRPRARCRAQSW